MAECKYSETEAKLFKHFNVNSLMFMSNISPPMLYGLLANEAFCYPWKYETGYIEALRRASRALNECKIHRMTPEWDAMITVEGEHQNILTRLYCMDHF